MTTHDIPGRLAEAATSKLLWAHAHVNTPESDRYMRLAADAENAVIGTPAANNNQIIAKLALALDWASEWSTPSFRALIQSAIADLEGPSAPTRADPSRVDGPRPGGARPVNAPALLAPCGPSVLKAKPAPRAKELREPTATPVDAVWLTLDRRSKPCVIEGVLYQSRSEACRKTGLSWHQVQAKSLPV